MKRLKKVFKAAVGVLCAVSVLCLTCINAFASAGVLAGGAVIALLAYLLVSSGAATQSQVNTMSDSSIVEMAQTNVEILPRYLTTAPGSLVNQAFIEAAADAADITHAGYSFLDFVINHQNYVSTSSVSDSDFDLKGYGAMFHYFQDNDFLAEHGKYYCDYIELVSTDGVLSSVIFHCSTPGNFEHYFTGSNVTDTKISTSELGSFTSYPGQSIFEMVKNGSCNDRFYNLSGDVRFTGEVIDDIKDKISDGGVSVVSNPIGTVNIDGKDYPVNADGTVVVGDTTYTINNDGSVTVNEGDKNNTYSPTYNFEVYDDTAIKDLIQDLIDTVDQNKKITDEEKSAVNAEIMDFTLSPTISTVFPFCIPWDFVRGIKLLAVEPEAPRFEVPFDLPEFGLFPGSENTVVIDFEEYSKYFEVVRWGFYLIFCFGLCFLTFKIVKGV